MNREIGTLNYEKITFGRKKDSFKYPAPQTMSYKEIETIFKEKLNQIIEE